MDSKELKILSMYAVKEDTSLTKKEKLDTLNYIMNENEDIYLKAMLLEGKRVENIDFRKAKEIEENFELQSESIRGKIKTFMSVLGAVTGIMIWAPYRFIKADTDKCVKKCGTFSINTQERQVCILKCRIDGVNKEINFFKSYNCKKNLTDPSPKNIEACEKKKKREIEKRILKIGKMKQKIDSRSKKLM